MSIYIVLVGFYHDAAKVGSNEGSWKGIVRDDFVVAWVKGHGDDFDKDTSSQKWLYCRMIR